MPTISSGGMGMPLVPFKISVSTPGAILQPQPPPWERELRRGSAGKVVSVVITEKSILSVRLSGSKP